MVIAVLGTLNPSAGDVSVFLPTEQAYVAGVVEAPDRPHLFAVYNLVAIFAGAVGALVSGVPESAGPPQRLGRRHGPAVRLPALRRSAAVVIFAHLPPPRSGSPRDRRDRSPAAVAARRRVLHTSRRTVLELAALFSLDSAGSGFVVTSLLVLWLHLRFDLTAGGHRRGVLRRRACWARARSCWPRGWPAASA